MKIYEPEHPHHKAWEEMLQKTGLPIPSTRPVSLKGGVICFGKGTSMEDFLLVGGRPFDVPIYELLKAIGVQAAEAVEHWNERHGNSSFLYREGNRINGRRAIYFLGKVRLTEFVDIALETSQN